MSQITRCPACVTLFNVLDDQLKAAQGWVRCGQCGEVFEASLNLLADSAGKAQAAAGQDVLLTALPPSPAASHDPGLPAEPALAPVGRKDDQGVASPGGLPALHAHPAVDAAVDTPAAAGPREERQEPVLHTDNFNYKAAGSPPYDATPRRQDASGLHGAPPFPDMAFVRKAQRNDFWREPLVRILLGVIVLALALGLMLQWAVRQMDVVALRAPQLVPWIQAVCRPLGCEIRPLRRIEWLVIENSSFSRTAPDAYRLSFTFKNTGDVDLEIPALEITLTDNQDQVVIRRVVTPAEFGATVSTLDAYSKLAGALTLKVTGAGDKSAASAAPTGLLPVTGYRIVAFYP